jgi:hypothetical protein
MWKYLGYAGIIIPVLGATYGGLQIASNLETKLNGAYEMAEDAHERIGGIEGRIDFETEEANRDIENGLEGLSNKLDNQKESMSFKVSEFQREVLQIQKILSVLEGTTQNLEKNSFSNVTTTQLDGVRELVYQVRDANMGKPDNTQMLYDLQRQVEDINRRMSELHNGNWN